MLTLPGTLSAGASPISSTWHNDLRAAVSELQTAVLPGHAYGVAYRAVAITGGTSTWQAYPLDTLATGATGCHLNAGQLVVDEAGDYEIRLIFSWATNGTGVRNAQVRLNSGGVVTGGTALASGPTPANASFSTSCIAIPTRRFTLIVGDYFEVWGWQSSGANLAAAVGLDALALRVERVA